MMINSEIYFNKYMCILILWMGKAANDNYKILVINLVLYLEFFFILKNSNRYSMTYIFIKYYFIGF